MSRWSRRRMLQQVALSAAGMSLAKRAKAAGVGAVTLVSAGKSRYSIVLATDASASERRGAEELQRFVEEMSGAQLPIVTDAGQAGEHAVFVGVSPALEQMGVHVDLAALGAEGYVLRTVGSSLVIAGGRQRGTMYGVYGFLQDKLGCRWFTSEVSRIPKTRTITVAAMDETHKPAYEYREPFFKEAWARDWAARNRVNGLHMDLDASVGGRFDYYPFVHTFAQLVPPEKYFKEHPEYFSFVAGARRTSQLCLTNADTLRIATETVRGWMRDHPEAAIYSVSQNDGTGWCECDNCKAVEDDEGGAHSGPVLRFVNAVAQAVEPEHPEKLIDTLAYWYTEDPPAKARPYKTVRIRLCPIGACVAHPFAECPYNAYFMKHLNAWSDITHQLYIWHYNTNFANFLLPTPDFDEIAADIPMYSHKGVVGIFFEGSPAAGGGAENAELRSYVMARLLWDPKANLRQMMSEFHEAYYGGAATPMRAYLELLHRQVRFAPRGKGYHAWIYDRSDAPYLNDAFVAEATRLFAQAEKSAGTEPAKKNVKKAKMVLDYIHFCRAKEYTVQGGAYQPKDMAGLKRQWAAIVASAQGIGMTDLHEHVAIAQDEKAFDAHIKPYRVVMIENAHLRVDTTPELQGRTVRIVDKRTGKDLLLRPNPGANNYPDMGGLAVTAQTEYVQSPVWPVTWAVVSSGPAELVLKGTAANGLTLERTLRVEGTGLHTSTTVRNTSQAEMGAILNSHCDVEAGDVAKTHAAFTSQDAKPVTRELIQPGLEPSGGQTYQAQDQPDGEWRFVRAGAPVMVNRFVKEQVARCSMSWSAKSEQRASWSVISVRKVLQPGETLTMESNYAAV